LRGNMNEMIHAPEFIQNLCQKVDMLNPRGEQTKITTTVSETYFPMTVDGYVDEFTFFAIRMPFTPDQDTKKGRENFVPRKYLEKHAYVWGRHDPVFQFDFVECGDPSWRDDTPDMRLTAVHPLCASAQGRFQGRTPEQNHQGVDGLKPMWAKTWSEAEPYAALTYRCPKDKRCKRWEYWKKKSWSDRNCFHSDKNPEMKDCNWLKKDLLSQSKDCLTPGGENIEKCGTTWKGHWGGSFCQTFWGQKHHYWKKSTEKFWDITTPDGKPLYAEKYGYRNCYAQHPRCNATTQAPVGSPRFDAHEQAAKCAKKIPAPSCLSKFTVSLKTCNTCCCKNTLSTDISHSLVHGSKSKCGVWFAAVDTMNRIVVSLQRFAGNFLPYFGKRCYLDSKNWPSTEAEPE